MLRVMSRLPGTLFPFTCVWSATFPMQPLRRPPTLPPEIWLEIFQWATYVYSSTTFEPLDPFIAKLPHNVAGSNAPIAAMRTKCALVLVCRAWRRVAMQLLYQHLDIRSPARAGMLLQTLRSSLEEPGYWTRYIEVSAHARGCNDIRYLQNLFRIFQYCRRTRVLNATWTRTAVPVEFVAAVRALYGPNLQMLCWNEMQARTPIEFLGSFSVLRVLDLRQFSADQSQSAAERTEIPSLTHLILSNDPSNVKTATMLLLPSLFTLTLHCATRYDCPVVESLLDAHGAKLTTVHLPVPNSESEAHAHMRSSTFLIPPAVFLTPNTCPVLDTLTFGIHSSVLVFDPSSPVSEPHLHTALRRIAIYSVRGDSLYPSKGPNETQNHLRSFTRAAFPGLETVKTIGFMVDADADTLLKDVFIWWSERFEKDGVDFHDGEGVVWAYCDAVQEESSKQSLLAP